MLDANPDITEQDIKDALNRPGDFGLSPNHEHYDEMFYTWSLGPVIRHRDSGLLEESNADALEKHLNEDETLENDWEITSCNHWAVGWCDHLSFKVLDGNGEPSRIFRVITEWFNALSDYPVANESDYSEREYEATLENISSEGSILFLEDSPDGWEGEVFGWLWDNNQSAIAASDYNGGYPERKEIMQALIGLGHKKLIDPDYMDED